MLNLNDTGLELMMEDRKQMTVTEFGIKRPDDFTPIPEAILEKTVIWQFERIVEKYPERLAIKSVRKDLTYAALNNAINNLAHRIEAEMGEDRSPVAFLFEDEVYSIIAFMAVLKTGRAFTGLHPSNSSEQLRAYLEDATARVLIVSAAFKEIARDLTGDRKSISVLYFDEINTDAKYPNPEYRVASNDPFGIFYTSGSTGKPKGVLIGHIFEAMGARHRIDVCFISPSDRVSHMGSVCYAAAYPVVLGALLSGASLSVFDLKANSAQKALDWIISDGLTIFTPTVDTFRTLFGLAGEGLVFEGLRLITLGGAPVTRADIELFKAHTAKDCVLLHRFASTEAGSICDYPVHHDTSSFQGSLPVGYPVLGKEVILLDDDGEKVGAGEEGEIVVRSRYLSLGYWRQPELTAQKFRPDSREPELRRYYTGDRGRWREDGALEILGRKDSQVKIRGYRVQLEAIDQALLELDGVKDAATIVHRTSGRGEQLVAYVRLSGDGKVSVSELRRGLSGRLPDYMVPTAFIRMKELPRTGTGKLARGKLPEPSVERPELETAYKAPGNEKEAQIAAVWQEILGLEKVGVDDNFFELGGDSLMALEMTLGVEKVVGRSVPQEFFKQPSISVLVALLDADEGEDERIGRRFVIKRKRRDARPRKRSKLTASNLKKLVKRVYSSLSPGNWIDRLIYLAVARHIVSKPYLEANRWVVEWSQNAFVRKVLYRRKYALFSRWVASLDGCQVEPSEAFQMNLLANLINSGLNRYSGKRSAHKSGVEDFKISPYPYWRTYGELLDAIPVGQMSEHFPISGAAYVKEAYERGKGVILLTFHGSPIGHRKWALERFLGVDEIPTISWRVPVRQSQYREAMYHTPETVAAAMNSEIAFYGQQLLQEGKIINIVADNSDEHGKKYRVELAGREYRVKSGFAELALNTGAAIIPHYTTCLPDGRVQMNLLKPLEAGEGDRDEKIERLIGEYFAFINEAWVTHPEAIRWDRMKGHYSRHAEFG
jgi:amino acid adenylation domain-containing protein